MPAVPLLIKQPSEDNVYTFEFRQLLADEESISSVTSVSGAPSGLTIGAPTHDSNSKVHVRISGGAADVKYKITAVVTTSLGNTKEGEGYLLVTDI